MRSYSQHCAIARSLDVIGDRWTLLIVRELWLRPFRYTDLRAALPGIATNLLAERLREMEADGIVTKTVEPPPIATAIYRLTERGAGLIPVLKELLRWGSPLMTAGQGDDAFLPHWLLGILELVFDGVTSEPPLVVGVAVAGEGRPVLVSVGPDGAHVHRDHPADVTAAVTISGTPDELLAVFRGEQPLDTLATTGTRAAQSRLRTLLAQRRRAASARRGQGPVERDSTSRLTSRLAGGAGQPGPRVHVPSDATENPA
jgi:DNA-binding HxlR family transcriptional regulator